MKMLFTLVLLAVGFSAVAQRSSSKIVTTDGRQLRIRVDMEQSGNSLHYNRSFDVTDLDASAVKALESSILDSLDQAFSGSYQRVAVRKREPKLKKTSCDDATAAVVINSDAQAADQALQASTDPTLSLSDVSPASVLFREDKANGRLWMQYIFKKDGEELVIERTANVVGKTEREKQAIIKETERSFGITTANQ
ncbi:hypothetical protein [Spirosoma fluminis]